MFRKKKKGLSFYTKEKKKSSVNIKEILIYIYIVVAALLFAFVTVFLFGFRCKVIGSSMEKTIYSGQNVLVNEMIYLVSSPKSGDVIAFYPNGNKELHPYVKRVVGVPGQTLEVIGGKLYVDGEVYENFSYDFIEYEGLLENPYEVQKDEYFVLGDNVNTSEDSRYGNLGAIKEDYIIGQVYFKFSDENHNMGLVK